MHQPLSHRFSLCKASETDQRCCLGHDIHYVCHTYIHTLCAGKHSFHLKVISPPSVCWLDCPSELKLVAGSLTTVVSSSSNPLIRRLNKSRWFGENLGCWCKFQKKWKGELLSKKKIQDFHQREDPSKGSFLKSGCVWNIHFTSFFSSSFRWPHVLYLWGDPTTLTQHEGPLRPSLPLIPRFQRALALSVADHHAELFMADFTAVIMAVSQCLPEESAPPFLLPLILGVVVGCLLVP